MRTQDRDDRYWRATDALRQRGAIFWLRRKRDRQGIMRDAGYWLDGVYLCPLSMPEEACRLAGIPLEEKLS